MSITDVDIILRRLSGRFHKIFYDREFVGCIQEDFQVILKNRNRCCVVVFPLLGPNYFKAIQYQAEIFDFEVFVLKNKKISSIAVCDKKFLIKNSKTPDRQIMPINEQQCGVGSTLKKKRPERQLYVPPAQRKLSINETQPQSEQGSSVKLRKCKKSESFKKVKNCNETCKLEQENVNQLSEEPIKRITDINSYKIMENYSFMWWKYALFKSPYGNDHKLFNLTVPLTNMLCRTDLNGSMIFDSGRNLFTLYILGNDFVLWQPKAYAFIRSRDTNGKIVPPSNIYLLNKEVTVCEKTALAECSSSIMTYLEVINKYSIYCDFDVYLLRSINSGYTFLDTCSLCYYYLVVNDEYNETDWINELLVEDSKNDDLKNKPNNTSHKTNLVVRDKPSQPEMHFQKNNLNYLRSSMQVIDNVKKEKNELEEEKEIMRKTKENINRKTRPIIKYVDEANDALKIDKDDVNNWEDLFNDEGQLQEDLLKQIIHKVGNDVTIIKAKEDYSDYFTKQVNIEELEHMVELYDFPPTLQTHDLIQSFSEINSDAMYIKWVDDTHAILVLGSSTQAQRAINVKNPLIKVRPMTAASKVTLSAAYKHGLKPAMKRPPTNLQTARRLITTHLGTKSGISKEASAKERDDLKAAREMKKIVKKNEQDAWEGNLKSSMSSN